MNYITLPVAKGMKILVGDFVFRDRRGCATSTCRHSLIRWIIRFIVVSERCFNAQKSYTKFFRGFYLRPFIGISCGHDRFGNVKIATNFIISFEAGKPMKIST